MTATIEVTAIRKEGGPLTKYISLGSGGELLSDGSACVMSRGRARRVRLNSAQQLADLIGSLTSSEAITLGALREDLPGEVRVVTKNLLNCNSLDLI